MNQLSKKETNQIKNITKYCPEDLFSGNKQKMITAIKGLVETPQTYFRIFKNGNLYYGNESNRKFSTVLQEIFNNNVENIDK